MIYLFVTQTTFMPMLFLGKCVLWLPNIWTHCVLIQLKQQHLRVKLLLPVRWCDNDLFLTKGCAINHSIQASREFPILLEYEDNWVVLDCLHIYLKNSAQKAKKGQQLKEKELELAAKGKARGICTHLDIQWL
jgi:hypothetical protein